MSYPMAPGQTEHVLPLSMFVRVGDTVYVSGHGAVQRDGTFVSSQFAEQMRYTLEQLRDTLTSAGVDFSHVVMVRSYVQHREHIVEYNQIFQEYFSAPYPARTTIINCLPDGLLFEIDCTADVRRGSAL